MRNVLFVTTVDTTVRAFLLPHIRYFLERGYHVEIATGVLDRNWLEEQLPDVPLHAISFHRSIKSPDNLKAFLAIRKLLLTNKYDLIHVHTPIASFVTRLASIFTRSQVLYTAHGFHFNENGSFLGNFLFKWAEKLAGYRTDKLVVINTDDKIAASQIVPAHKISYIKGVGIDTELYKPVVDEGSKAAFKHELGIAPQTKVVTHIAEFNGNKRQIDVVEATDCLKKSGVEDFIVLLVGNGSSLEEIQEIIISKNLEDRIQCLGYRSDIAEVLSISDIGLLVSLREGLPRSIMEMMAMEIPVIATEIRGNRDLIRDGETGYLVPVKSPELLAQKMKELLLNEERRRLFGHNARERVLTEFALPRIITNMELVYKELGI
ncbi:glycosyltransferase family 4 protein [Paenibacillus sp. FJAT-26967]|uniref:glycosyltransferase family 4 protein n=1 Tax=Paenibacillus sp. FJAT-26967 TaxID=1729690 RepID=UPI000838F8CD|nr:glycosyltransferase family 4 protein [Paenibacillus sp. FJAT-26967]